jgi:hypothetical protein
LAQNKSAEPDFPEKRSPDCTECDRVWNGYALATRKHVAAILAREGSTQTDDIEKMKILNDEALEAAHRRALARKAVRDHAATHAGVKREPQK